MIDLESAMKRERVIQMYNELKESNCDHNYFSVIEKFIIEKHQLNNNRFMIRIAYDKLSVIYAEVLGG